MYFSDETVENPAFGEAMRRLRQEASPENQGRLLQELALRTRFILPVMLSKPAARNKEGRLVVPPDATARVALLTGGDGKHYFPAFTNRQEWEKWRAHQGQNMAVAQFDDYVELLDKDPAVSGVVIDAFGDSYMLTREEIGRLKGIKDSMKVAGREERLEVGTTVRLEAPKKAEALEQALGRYFRTQPGVRAAYLRMMEKEGERSYLLVLSCNGGFDRAVADGAAKAAAPYLNGVNLRIAPALSELGERVSRSAQPFYTAAGR